MRRPDQDDQDRHSTEGGSSQVAWIPILVALAIMLVGCLSTVVVLQLEALRPKVGDIVAFKPGSEDTDPWQTAMPAASLSPKGSPMAKCSLDPNVMARKGGSFIVEGLEEGSSTLYRIHWAGPETADKAGNCGASASLLVSRTDLQRLANAAGGFGVGDKGIVR